LNASLVDSVITAFLFDTANKVSPAPVNIVIAAFLLDMAHEPNQVIVDFTTCHLYSFEIFAFPKPQ
jgi:hypothetical protein